MVREYVERGFWTSELTVDYWDRNSERFPGREAIVDRSSRLTWAQARQQIDRIALCLVEMGFGKDQVLLAQLYNTVDLVLIRLACEKAGILLAIVPHTFRRAEIKALLSQVEARGAFIPSSFRGFDYLQMFRELQPEVPSLRELFVIGDAVPAGTISVQWMKQQPLDKKNLGKETRFEPFGFEEIMTTSGTTGLPKAVEWPGCARLAQGRDIIQRLRLAEDDVICAFSPSYGATTEALVYRAAPQIPAKTVLLEHFTPEDACTVIQQEKVTVGGIVPTMLVRLINYPDLHRHDLSSLRVLLSTAASLPYQVAEEAEEKLGCSIVQGYGSMDSGGLFLNQVDEPREARLATVGRPLTGSDVRLIDEKGKEVAPGQVGAVTVTGPHCISGYYLDPETTKANWKDGRFNVGDLGRFDEEGRLQLMGRQKDVIIRGGQNIYPKEVEDRLAQHPKILEVAVVKMPDSVMGEKACAYVVKRSEEALDFEEVIAFLRQTGIAKFKWPERVEFIDALPLVPGGNKVNKRLLEKAIGEKLRAEGIR